MKLVSPDDGLARVLEELGKVSTAFAGATGELKNYCLFMKAQGRVPDCVLIPKNMFANEILFDMFKEEVKRQEMQLVESDFLKPGAYYVTSRAKGEEPGSSMKFVPKDYKW